MGKQLIIAVSREFGSGGQMVTVMVLQRLAFQAVVVHKDIQEIFCSSSGILRKVVCISAKSLLKLVNISLKLTPIKEI